LRGAEIVGLDIGGRILACRTKKRACMAFATASLLKSRLIRDSISGVSRAMHFKDAQHFAVSTQPIRYIQVYSVDYDADQMNNVELFLNGLRIRWAKNEQ